MHLFEGLVKNTGLWLEPRGEKGDWAGAAVGVMTKRKKPKRRRRPSPQNRDADDANLVVGFFASDGTTVMCDGDACVISGSSQDMQRIVERLAPTRRRAMTVRKTTFGEIWQGLQMGAAYAFDEQAYEAFRPLANRAGWPLAEEDFSDPGPLGYHFVRVQLLTA